MADFYISLAIRHIRTALKPHRDLHDGNHGTMLDTVTALWRYTNTTVSVWLYLFYNIDKRVCSIHNVSMLLPCRTQIKRICWTVDSELVLRNGKDVQRNILYAVSEKQTNFMIRWLYLIYASLCQLDWTCKQRAHHAIKHQKIKADTLLTKTSSQN